jgi:phospholipid/cholesterol/gamma-HCH transport system substrate-binding protein
MAQTGTESAPEEEDEIVTIALGRFAWARITIVISFAIVIIGTLVYVLSHGGRDLFQRSITLRTYLPDGTGLSPQGLVEIDGIPVGRIKSVGLSHSNEPSRIVLVEVSVRQRFLSAIPVDSKTEVTADNLLGDKYINIRKGVAGEFVKPGDELLPQPPNNNFNPADLIASLETSIKRISAILDLVEDPQSELGQLVQGDALYRQIRDDIAGIQTTMHKVASPSGVVGQAIFGHDLYDQLRQPFLDIDKLLASYQSGEGPIGHALATSDQYDQIRGQIADFHKSIADLKANQFLTSDDLYNNLLATIKNLDGIIGSIAAGPMLSNAQLYESLNGSSRAAEKFLKDFRQNPQKFLLLKVF